jgi:hypothetical protein
MPKLHTSETIMALVSACSKHPEQRVMQVIVNALGSDPFYIENADAEAKLIAYAAIASGQTEAS